MNVHSVFASVDGEVNYFGQGSATVFVRLSGCNLRCSYCDTKYAQNMGATINLTVGQIINAIGAFSNIKKVTITGGEPLLQKDDVSKLCFRLMELHYDVSIETNGSILITPWEFYGARIVADWKLPSSGVAMEMDEANFVYLGDHDYIKFVVDGRDDFDEALYIVKRLGFTSCHAKYAFSPMLTDDRAQDKERVNQLVKWMLEKPMPGMTLNIQLHKILELNEPK